MSEEAEREAYERGRRAFLEAQAYYRFFEAAGFDAAAYFASLGYSAETIADLARLDVTIQ